MAPTIRQRGAGEGLEVLSVGAGVFERCTSECSGGGRPLSTVGAPPGAPPVRYPVRHAYNRPVTDTLNFARRFWRPGLLVAMLAVLALVGLAWQTWHARAPVTGEAEWIWADLPDRLPAPSAFHLVRDFEVSSAMAEELETTGARGARFLVLGDEEYVLHLNGRRLGSNRYRAGAPLDVYAVGDLLLPGMNRLAIELRSSRGAGGFLAALEVGDLNLLVSDDSWRVVRHYLPGLVEGWVPLPELEEEAGEAAAGFETGEGNEPEEGRSPLDAPRSERPISWGPPPVGRWGRPRPGVERPLLEAVGDLCPEGASRRAGAATAPSGGEAGGDQAGGLRGGGRHRGDGEPGVAVFDFGRPVTGYLVLEHPPSAPAAPAQVSLLAFGDSPPQILGRGPDDIGVGETGEGEAGEDDDGVSDTGVSDHGSLPLVTVPGRSLWTDVVPRTFRYVAIAGLSEPLAAALLEVDPAALAALPGALRSEVAEPGLHRLGPRPRRTPTEDTVRRRLAGVEKPDPR